MNKIIKALLEAKYPTLNVDILLEIVSNTPNATIATEMLCGLYEEPLIRYKTVKSSNNDGVLTFIDYDKWNDRVNYSYIKKETQGGYFPKGTKVEDVTMETFNSMKVPEKRDETTYLYIPTGKTSKDTSYTSYNSWISQPA